MREWNEAVDIVKIHVDDRVQERPGDIRIERARALIGEIGNWEFPVIVSPDQRVISMAGNVLGISLKCRDQCR
jgi:hypothetical protein